MPQLRRAAPPLRVCSSRRRHHQKKEEDTDYYATYELQQGRGRMRVGKWTPSGGFVSRRNR